MALRRVRLELARDHDFPNGSATRGYEFVAPLSEDGHLDAEEWRGNKDKCTVRRFWENEPDENGTLRHVGRGWHFHYAGQANDDDEPLYKLDRHSIVENEYLSVTEHDGELRTFRVVRLN